MAAPPAPPLTQLERPAPVYGSDPSGLVCGFYFEAGRPARPIGGDEAPACLNDLRQALPGGFLWLHFSLSNAAAVPWLRGHLALPEAFYDSLGQAVGATSLEQEAEALVAVIHDVPFDFSFDPAGVSTASLCIEPHLLVSARLRPLRSLDGLRAAVKAGQVFRSPVELLAHLLRDQGTVLAGIVRQATRRVDGIEDSLLAHRLSVSRTELGVLRRTLVRLQRLLAPEPAAFFRLLSRPPGWINAEDLQDLREAAEEFAAGVTDSAALVERVKLLQEELAAMVGEQTNRTIFVLTVVTVLALPINLVAGLFGMNVGGIPFSAHSAGFWIVVGTLLPLTAALLYFALGRRKDQ